jgi:hypothetical protein
MAALIKSVQKCEALARSIAENLAVRLPTLTITKAYGTAGFPTVSLSAGGTGTCNYFIRVRTIEGTLEKDALGLDATMFSPIVIQMATEAPVAAPYNTIAQNVAVLGEVLGKGCMFEWYESVNTVVPVEASITGTPVTTYSDLYWSKLSAS